MNTLLLSNDVNILVSTGVYIP